VFIRVLTFDDITIQLVPLYKNSLSLHDVDG